MIGTLVRNLNESVKGYFTPRRKDFRFPLKVSVEPDKTTGSLRRKVTGRFVGNDNLPSLCGETKDFSESGIAFIVPFIRVGNDYLVGDGRTVNIELTLPNGTISFQAIGQRYEPIDQHSSASKFLIGAKITTMSTQDREIYLSYLFNKQITEKTASVDLVLNLPR